MREEPAAQDPNRFEAMTALELHRQSIVWDQHGCLPLSSDASVSPLRRYLTAGVSFASINIGMDSTSSALSLEVLDSFRRQIKERPELYLLASSVDDVRQAHASKRLAVAFDLEGTEPLDGDLDMVETYHSLGVRTMLIAYNQANRAGGGCHGDQTIGLTDYGKAVVAEMNRVGMLVDATHCSYRTTMDLFETSTAPVVFSHAVPMGVKHHPRNVSDEQMKACAATGGVIGINGVSLFLGEPARGPASAEAVFRAVDYVATLVGPRHVGLGLDYVFDQDEMDQALRDKPETFPADGEYLSGMSFTAPELLPELTRSMLAAGYGEDTVKAILGENFLRVVGAVWPDSAG